ncbi:MAG: hypothetical protein H6650_08945 [Ardenticatenales bacterium]|nr:hypothetical protein [Ardenticatenales bacterium]
MKACYTPDCSSDSDWSTPFTFWSLYQPAATPTPTPTLEISTVEGKGGVYETKLMRDGRWSHELVNPFPDGHVLVYLWAAKEHIER